ncbi:MAG: hypothetical protein AAGF35_12720, partial [Pseudomonadota bacterium]
LARLGSCAAILLAMSGFAESSIDYKQLETSITQTPFGVEQCQALAQTFGDWVVQQRDGDMSANRLLSGRELGETLHANCRAAIREVERATNENEAALESLYRSELWYELNRALASLRYWQAWIDLSLAQRGPDKETRVTALSRAERGFQASSLRILYPGLVYGSWLGLAYVAQLQDDLDTMQQRLTLLKTALAPDPDNPLHEIVDTELGVLEMQVDIDGVIELVEDEPLTQATARLLEEQAFALLQKRRDENTGGYQAADNLRQLIAGGYLDDRLFARIMSYRDEIVGYELGDVQLLVEAEFGYAYQQYETTVLKFRQFLASNGVDLPLDLSVFSYHYAVSLYQIGLYRDAMDVVGQLLSANQLPGDLHAPLIKLQFIVAEALYQEDPSSMRAKLLASAARDFIANGGTDPDVASAHLALARVGENSAEQVKHLNMAASDKRLKANVLAVELELSVSRFQAAAAGSDRAELMNTATAALELLEELPKEERESLGMQVLTAQMQSVLVEEPDELLELLAQLASDPGLDPTQRRVLIWSQLRLIDRLQSQDKLEAFVTRNAQIGSTEFDHELYVLTREFSARSRDRDLAALSGRWLPSLQDKPQLQRQVWVMNVEALRAIGQQADALESVQAMLAAFPQSGDAWQQLSTQAEIMGDTFAAERALAHIAGAEPEGSPRWLDVSLHRLQLLASAQPIEARACVLGNTIDVYNHLLEAEQQESLAVLRAGMECGMPKEQ